MHKFVVVALLVAAVACQIEGAPEDMWYGWPDVACLSQGGWCIATSECAHPIGQASQLCFHQPGYDCCVGLPIHEKRCEMHGGECFNKDLCKHGEVYSEASNCGGEDACCIRT